VLHCQLSGRAQSPLLAACSRVGSHRPAETMESDSLEILHAAGSRGLYLRWCSWPPHPRGPSCVAPNRARVREFYDPALPRLRMYQGLCCGDTCFKRLQVRTRTVCSRTTAFESRICFHVAIAMRSRIRTHRPARACTHVQPHICTEYSKRLSTSVEN